MIVPTTGNLDIFDYGLKAAERWELGSRYRSGLPILVAVNDRKMHIFTGYGIEVFDAVASRIIREDTPRFKQGDYAGGLSQGINHIEERLTTDPDILAQADANAQAQQDRQSHWRSSLDLWLIYHRLHFGHVLTSVSGGFGALVATGGFVYLLQGVASSHCLFGVYIVDVFVCQKICGGRGWRRGFIVLPVVWICGGGFGGGGFGSGHGGGGGGFGGGGVGGSGSV